MEPGPGSLQESRQQNRDQRLYLYLKEIQVKAKHQQQQEEKKEREKSKRMYCIANCCVYTDTQSKRRTRESTIHIYRHLNSKERDDLTQKEFVGRVQNSKKQLTRTTKERAQLMLHSMCELILFCFCLFSFFRHPLKTVVNSLFDRTK